MHVINNQHEKISLNMQVAMLQILILCLEKYMQELRVHWSTKPRKVYASTTQYKSNIETNPSQ